MNRLDYAILFAYCAGFTIGFVVSDKLVLTWLSSIIITIIGYFVLVILLKAAAKQ